MDKNTITGFVLIGAVLVGFSYFGRSRSGEVEAEAKQDSIQQQQVKTVTQPTAKEKTLSDSTFYAHYKQVKGDYVTLKNQNVEIKIDKQGGTVAGVRMLGRFKDQQNNQVSLLTKSNMVLKFDSRNGSIIKSSDYHFDAVQQKGDSIVTLRLTAKNGGTLDFKYELLGDSYMTNFTVKATNLETTLAGDKIHIAWEDTCRQQEKGKSFENRYSSLSYKESDDDVENLSSNGSDDEVPEGNIDWVAFKNQFFSCVLISHEEFSGARLKSEQLNQDSVLKFYRAEMDTRFDRSGEKETRMQLYLGPNDYHLLKSHNKLSLTNKELELEGLIYLGWPLFRWINKFFIINIFDWLTGWGLPMGIVLLLLTVLIKIIVYPTTRKSFMSSARMRLLKPKIDELSKKYPNKEDAMKKQQEMMGIYREYGVSPMGGCLPMLIQMPIWIALFNFVPNAIQLRGESFLWADDLSAYDDVLSWGTSIPLLGDHLSIFCVLFCATNIINTMITMRQQKNQMSTEQAGQMKVMRYMMYIMPIMFFFMFNDYSSGLCYYYFLSSLTSILIMWLLRKRTDDKKLMAQLEAYREAHKNDPKKMSSLATRLEAMQKQQEMMRQMKQQQRKK